MSELNYYDVFDEDFLDDEDLSMPSAPQKRYRQPSSWTVISALDWVLRFSRGSGLEKSFWKRCDKALAFLREKLQLTNMQIVVLAIMVETGDFVSWRVIGKHLGCSRISIMVYTDEIEELVKKRWIYTSWSREMGAMRQGFRLVYGVVAALRHNEAFVPEKIDNLDIQSFMDRLESHTEKNAHHNSTEFAGDEQWMKILVEANPHLPLCHEILKFDNIHEQSLLLLIAFDYAQWADSDDEGLTLESIDTKYPEDYDCQGLRYNLREGTHPLIVGGFIEQKCENGIVNINRYTLTQRAKTELLKGYKPSKSKCLGRHEAGVHELCKHDQIKEKTMFYNEKEQVDVDRLSNLLKQDSFTGVQNRLEEMNMRKGFACLFYGEPGTGKTETVLQIARQTGRDIMQVDIAGMRDKYVGESEKNIKAVFDRYRELCSHTAVKPILFFNEADGILGKRTDVGGSNSSVQKMDNAMQNIILQEIENLDGILIATTNLTNNLDSAFERRFIFKIEFEKPEPEVKAKIFTSMINGITFKEALLLASRYDFSGGQIENIARKRALEYILNGKEPTFEELEQFCKEEVLGKRNARLRIGGFSKIA